MVPPHPRWPPSWGASSWGARIPNRRRPLALIRTLRLPPLPPPLYPAGNPHPRGAGLAPLPLPRNPSRLSSPPMTLATHPPCPRPRRRRRSLRRARAAPKTCACCTLVIAGKVFYCARCHLVTYCGRDCQASDGACLERFDCFSFSAPSRRGYVCLERLMFSPAPPFFRSQIGKPRTRSCAASKVAVPLGEGPVRLLFLPRSSPPTS